MDAEHDANVRGALCVKKPQHLADACITKELKWGYGVFHTMATIGANRCHHFHQSPPLPLEEFQMRLPRQNLLVSMAIQTFVRVD